MARVVDLNEYGNAKEQKEGTEVISIDENDDDL